MIFAGKYIQQQWFPDDDEVQYKKWYFDTSPTSWTNDNIALKWLQKVFIPHTKPENPEQ
jgi:hypothetical protein